MNCFATADKLLYFQTNPKQVLQDEEFQVITAAHNHPPRSSLQKSKALALISKLPPRPVIEELVVVFFAEVNWHYFILERFYFDDLFSHWQAAEADPVRYLCPGDLLRELQYLPAMLFQVLALTLQFLPPDAPALSQLSPNELASSQRYSDMGEELLAVLGRQGAALTAVQADYLRSSWLKNCGRGIESWHAIGNAIRSV